MVLDLIEFLWLFKKERKKKNLFLKVRENISLIVRDFGCDF